MKRLFARLSLIAGLCLAGAFMTSVAVAADIKDGRALVNPAPDDRYAIDGFIFGKAELFGYISDMKDTDQITGIVLRRGKSASDEQRRVVASVADGLQLEAFAQDGRKLTPLHKD